MNATRDNEKLLNAHCVEAFLQSQQLKKLRQDAGDKRLGWVYRQERYREAERRELRIRVLALQAEAQLIREAKALGEQ